MEEDRVYRKEMFTDSTKGRKGGRCGLKKTEAMNMAQSLINKS